MTRFRHSRERGNPVKSIPLRWETPAFEGVTALEIFYETIKVDSLVRSPIANFYCL